MIRYFQNRYAMSEKGATDLLSGSLWTALMDLSNGGVDAVLVEFVVADYYITALDADEVLLDETLAGEEYGIGFR